VLCPSTSSLLGRSGPVELCLQGMGTEARILLVVAARLDGDVVAFGGYCARLRLDLGVAGVEKIDSIAAGIVSTAGGPLIASCMR
jgi:hypothetical protein